MLRFVREPFARQHVESGAAAKARSQTAWAAWSHEGGRADPDRGIFRRLQSSIAIAQSKKNHGQQAEDARSWSTTGQVEADGQGGESVTRVDAGQLQARVVDLETELRDAVRRAEVAEEAGRRAGAEATALRGKLQQLRTALQQASPNHPALVGTQYL